MKYRTELKYALLLPIFLFLLLCLEYATGLQTKYIPTGVIVDSIAGGVIMTLVLYRSIREKRDKEMGGKMTFMEAFRTGVLTAAFAVPLSLILTTVFLTLVNPHYFDTQIRYALDNGFYTDEDAARTYFSLKSYLLQGFVGTLGFGTFISLILGLVLRGKTS